MGTTVGAAIVAPGGAARRRPQARRHFFERGLAAVVVLLVTGAVAYTTVDVEASFDPMSGGGPRPFQFATVHAGEPVGYSALQYRAGNGGPARAHLKAEVKVNAATAAQAEIVQSAIRRFAEAGLELPPLDVTFHEDRTQCGGNHGSFRWVDAEAEVKICNARTHIVLHELAHAWEAAVVDERTRRRFTQDLGLASWNDPEVPWSDRGIERAANTIALVLNWDADPASGSRALSRLCAYETLTGHRLRDDIPAGCDDIAVK